MLMSSSHVILEIVKLMPPLKAEILVFQHCVLLAVLPAKALSLGIVRGWGAGVGWAGGHQALQDAPGGPGRV